MLWICSSIINDSKVSIIIFFVRSLSEEPRNDRLVDLLEVLSKDEVGRLRMLACMRCLPRTKVAKKPVMRSRAMANQGGIRCTGRDVIFRNDDRGGSIGGDNVTGERNTGGVGVNASTNEVDVAEGFSETESSVLSCALASIINCWARIVFSIISVIKDCWFLISTCCQKHSPLKLAVIAIAAVTNAVLKFI